MHQNKSSDEAHGLIRELGLKEGIAIGLGTMIGAGIFVLSAIAAETGWHRPPLFHMCSQARSV